MTLVPSADEGVDRKAIIRSFRGSLRDGVS